MGNRIFSEDGAVEMREIVYMGEEALSILLQVLRGYTHWLAERIRMDVDEFMWEVAILCIIVLTVLTFGSLWYRKPKEHEF